MDTVNAYLSERPKLTFAIFILTGLGLAANGYRIHDRVDMVYGIAIAICASLIALYLTLARSK